MAIKYHVLFIKINIYSFSWTIDKMNRHSNLYFSFIPSVPLFQEHYQYLYRAMLSLVGSTDGGVLFSCLDKHGRILKTDKVHQAESMESLV